MGRNSINIKVNMKRIFACLIVIGVHLFSGSLYAQTTRIYSLGWEDYPPYQYKDDLGRVTGLDMELVRAIMGGAGTPIRMKEVPWKRHLEEIKSGRIDMASGASKTPERKGYAYFSDPYRTGSAALYIRKNDMGRWRFKKIDEIIGTSFRLCVTRGYYYGDEYAVLKENNSFMNRVNEVTNERQCFLMLKKGNVDGFIADPMSATASLRKEEILDDVNILMTVHADESHVMFSKKAVTPQIVALFNDNLKRLKGSGEYYKILEKYMRVHPISQDVKLSEKTSMKKNYKKQVIIPIRITPKDKVSPEALAAFEMISLNRYLKEDRNDIHVLRLQIILKELGLYNSELDSYYSADITSIIRSFQLQHNLIPDGIVGPLTYRTLGNYL